MSLPTWDTILNFLIPGTLAVIGGTTNYVYRTWRDAGKFSGFGFCVNLLVAFFIGLVVGDLVPKSTPFRDGLILMSGYSSFPILAELEKRIPTLIKSKFDGK